MSAQVTIALVGYGIGCVNILRELLHLEAEVIVVDPAEERRLEAIKVGAAEAVPTIGDLPKLKGVIVAAPDGNLEEIIDEALDLKVPVLTEKPFTSDFAAATRVSKLAHDHLFVMQTMRHHVGVEELASIAANKEFGLVEWIRVTRTSWNQHHLDLDAPWRLLSQDLSVILQILGEIPHPLTAVPEIHDGAVTGTLAVLGDMPRVVIEDSVRYADNRREVRLHCTDGIVVLPDLTSGYLEITPNPDPHEPTVPQPDRRQYAPAQPLHRELKTFTEYLGNRRRAKPRGSVADGLLVVETTDQLRTLAGFPAETP